MGSLCKAGMRESNARTGSTTGAVMRVSTAIMGVSSITNQDRIACKNIAPYMTVSASRTVVANR